MVIDTASMTDDQLREAVAAKLEQSERETNPERAYELRKQYIALCHEQMQRKLRKAA